MNELADNDEGPRSNRIGVLLMLVLAFVLRAYNLQGQSLSSDELIEASIARLEPRQIIEYPDGFPPLYHLLLAAWSKAFSTPEAGRWFSVLTGVAAVYAAARWATQAVGPQAGLFAAALLAVSPLHIYLSQETRAYSIYICLASFALMFFFEALRTDRPQTWLGFAISAGLAVNTHYYAALLVALLGLLLVFYHPHWPKMGRGLAAFIAVGICSAPAVMLLPGDVSYQSDGFAAKAPLLATLGHTAYAFFAGYSLGPSLGELHVLPMREAAAMAAPWVAAFAVIGSWLMWQGYLRLRRTPYGLGIVFLAVASAPIIAAAGALADVGPKVRYWSWILVPVLVWLAAGTAHGWNGATRWITRAAFAALVSLQLWAVVNHSANPRYATEDARAAAKYLQQQASNSGPIFVVVDYMAPPVRYYLNGAHTLDNWLPHLEHPDVSEPANQWLIHPRSEMDVRGSRPLDEAALNEWLADVRSLAAEDGRFWLVYSRPFHGDPQGTLLAFLEDNGWVERDRQFPGVVLYRGQVPLNR